MESRVNVRGGEVRREGKGRRAEEVRFGGTSGRLEQLIPVDDESR